MKSRRPSSKSISAKKTQPLATKLYVLLMYMMRGLAIHFKGRLVAGKEFIILYHYLTPEEQKHHLGEVKEGKKSIANYDRSRLANLTLKDVPFRQALAQQRLLNESAGAIQKIARGRSQRRVGGK